MRILLLLALGVSTVFAQDGAAVYKTHCAMCHDSPQARVPSLSALRAMPPAAILNALQSGSMKTEAQGLTVIERYSVVGYLARAEPPKPEPLPPSAFCAPGASAIREQLQAPHWSGWSTDLGNSRFQDASAAGMTAAEIPKLKLKWAFSLGAQADARGQIVAAAGRVFTGSQSGAVYSLDAQTGCIDWIFQAQTALRSGVAFSASDGPRKTPAVFFGDQSANVYALDASSGTEIWKVRVEDHEGADITATPLVYQGVLYVTLASSEEVLASLPGYQCCTSRGAVVALDSATGKQLWKTYTIAETPGPTRKNAAGGQMFGPSGAGVWSTPTLDTNANALYVATGDNYSDPATETSDAVLALDRKTGKLLWSRQLYPGDATNVDCSTAKKLNCPEQPGPDLDFGQPPILVTLSNGHRMLVIGQKSGMVHALDPDKRGTILWQFKASKGGPLGGIQWGSAADRENMYVAVSDLTIRGGKADPTAPLGFRLELDPNAGGGLIALRLATGEKAWKAEPGSCGERKNCSPAQSGAVTAIPGAVFSGSVDGHLRAYATADGHVIWDFDTVRDYETVNGRKARGGSLDGPGPAIAGGMLFVNSGYGAWGGMPGNVLLAFSAK